MFSYMRIYIRLSCKYLLHIIKNYEICSLSAKVCDECFEGKFSISYFFPYAKSTCKITFAFFQEYLVII